MAELSGFPYFELEFTKDGKPFVKKKPKAGEKSQEQTLIDSLGGVTDLFVIAHGWNNDMKEARSLYKGLFEQVRAQLDANHSATLGARTFAIAGVLWPSKKFADKDLIAGGGAASTSSPEADAELEALVDGFAELVDDSDARKSLERAKTLIPLLDDDPDAQREFASIIRAYFPHDAAVEETIDEDFFLVEGDELLARLGRPGRKLARPGGAGGAAVGPASDRPTTTGGAAGLGDMFSGVKAGARNLLNFVTYFTMKGRAGTVGQRGVNPVLKRIKQEFPDLRIHLVGHSFGGRLVTAAAAGDGSPPPLQVASMTLLQAAFSHYGFAENYEANKNGFFRRVITDKCVKGPVLITHTVNDTAVG